MRNILFRRVTKPALCCAVPEGAAIPSFLKGETWEALGSFDEDDLPSGFREDPARYSFKIQGFYVFTDLSHRPQMSVAAQGTAQKEYASR